MRTVFTFATLPRSPHRNCIATLPRKQIHIRKQQTNDQRSVDQADDQTDCRRSDNSIKQNMQRQAKFRLKQQAAKQRLELADVEEHIKLNLSHCNGHYVQTVTIVFGQPYKLHIKEERKKEQREPKSIGEM